MQSILMTDLHLLDPDSSPDAATHAARVWSYLDRAAGLFPDADCCIIVGDLADAGEVAAYRWLKHKLDTLPFPTVPMLGNHDDRDAFRAVFQGNGGCGDYVQSARNLGELGLVFLDTLDPGSDSGILCAERLAWLDEQLSQARNVCLFMHHPPCDIGDPVLDPIKLANATELETVLRRYGSVRQIFFGRVHRTMFLVWNGIPCASLDSLVAVGSGNSKRHNAVSGLLKRNGSGLALTVKQLT